MITDLTRSAPAESRPYGACLRQVYPGPATAGPGIDWNFGSGAAQKGGHIFDMDSVLEQNL